MSCPPVRLLALVVALAAGLSLCPGKGGAQEGTEPAGTAVAEEGWAGRQLLLQARLDELPSAPALLRVSR